MAVKESLEENKQFILDSLPTQELKDEFLAELGKIEEPAPPSVEEQVAEAEAPSYVEKGMYGDIKKELENHKPVAPMSKKEEKAAIEAELKNVPTEPNEQQDEPQDGAPE